jgi:hypothetical protein
VAPYDLLLARSRLVHAELGLTENASRRVALRRSLLKYAKEAEALAKAGWEAGRVRPGEFAQARADRLAAEISLLRGRAGDKPSVAQAAQIRKLLRTRRDTLGEVFKGLAEEIEAGRGALDRGLEARRQLLLAELELAFPKNPRPERAPFVPSLLGPIIEDGPTAAEA